MAQLRCSKCGKSKSTTQFAKANNIKRGYQNYCKPCKKEFQDPYMKADKSSLIYTITNPIGETYCGETQRTFNVRTNSHRSEYNYRNGTFPKLHASFDKWGIDAHIFQVVKDCGDMRKEDLLSIERNMIKAYKLNNKSLNH